MQTIEKPIAPQKKLLVTFGWLIYGDRVTIDSQCIYATVFYVTSCLGFRAGQLTLRGLSLTSCRCRIKDTLRNLLL